MEGLEARFRKDIAENVSMRSFFHKFASVDGPHSVIQIADRRERLQSVLANIDVGEIEELDSAHISCLWEAKRRACPIAAGRSPS